jgi:metal-responsive CopG/Arc/MetJ family transcriptional regulator
MRTTITLDKDVASRIERLKKTRSFTQLVNDALRAGLDEMERASATTTMPYSITPVEGMPRRTDLDNVAEVLAEIERDDFR